MDVDFVVVVNVVWERVRHVAIGGGCVGNALIVVVVVVLIDILICIN